LFCAQWVLLCCCFCCCAAGSNKIVFEPKSKTSRAKQHSQSSTVHSSSINSSGSTLQMGDLTLAVLLSSGTSHAMDTDSSIGSDQVLLRQGVGRQPGPQLQMKQQQQQMMLRQQPPPPPPPPPRAAAYGNNGGISSSVRQQWQQLQQGAAAAAAAAAAMAARQGVLVGVQHPPHQHNGGFNSDPLPDISAAVAAAAAAQQQQQQQDILKAVMQAASNSAAQLAAQQQQQVYVPMMGYAQQQQMQQQCHDQAMAMAAGLDSAAQQQLLMHSGSFNASLSGFCLMDTSSISALQQDCLQSGNASHPSHVLNAASTLGAAADGAVDCYNSYNSLLMHAHGTALSGSGAVLPPPQACDSLAAAAAAASIASGAAADRTPWRQISMSMDGTYGTAAAANAAAANAATVAAAVSASGLARSGYANVTAESQQQLLQRQIMSAGCNVLSGGNNMSVTGPVSGSCLPNVPCTFRKQPAPQQQHGMHDEEQWMSGCGVGGYFDLQPSSSQNSGSFHAGLANSSMNAGQAVRASAQQQAAVLSAPGGLPNLRAISDSCMMAANGGYAALSAARQQQLQQALAAKRTLHGSSAAAAAASYQQQQQQQLNMLASRPPSSAVSGSCLPASPHEGDAMAAAAAAAAVSGSFNIADAAAADGAADGLSAQLNAINLTSGGLNTPAAAAAAVAGAGGRVSVAVASETAVVQALALHLDSITNLSGAEVQIRSDAGTLMVWLTGSSEQVRMANNIVNLLLSQQLPQQ
jgi:hypothetical protein